MSQQKTILISESSKRKTMSDGQLKFTKQVVTLTHVGQKKNGNPAYHSETRHIINNKK